MVSFFKLSASEWMIPAVAVLITSCAIYYSKTRSKRSCAAPDNKQHNVKCSRCCTNDSEVHDSYSTKENEVDEAGNATAAQDVEDVDASLVGELMGQSTSKRNIVERKQKLKVLKGSNMNQDEEVTELSLPGAQKVFVKSYGCSHNTSDCEYMMGLLSAYGYRFVDSLESSDVCLINSCTVKNPSQDVVTSLVGTAKSLGKAIVISGCIPQADRHLPGLDGASLIGVTQIDRIVEVVEQTLNGNVVRLLSRKSLPSLNIPKIRRNPLIEIVPLSTGCLGSCTYCKTKHARGKLGSYEVEALLKRVSEAISDGVKQIWLTSEDTGAYGIDLGTNIVKLLDAIVPLLPEGVMLRLGMTNPPYMKEHLADIGRILKHPRVFEFIHIPVQSGSNSTLEHMMREYTREEFEYTVETLRGAVPNLSIATDIICGFPTETEEHHKETLTLLEKHKFPVLNISQFYPRPGTPAAMMKRVATQIVKQRTREVTKLFESYSCFDDLLNTVQMVWFTEHSDRSDHSVGHTKQYVKVLAKRDAKLMGTCAKMKITATHKWHVVGELLSSG